MLLRSSSLPILKSWIPSDHFTAAAATGDHPLPKSRSLPTSFSPCPMYRTFSGGDLTSHSSAAPAPKLGNHGGLPPSIPYSEQLQQQQQHSSESNQSLVHLLSNSGLDGFYTAETERNVSTLVGCGGSGSGGGRICGGRGAGGGDDCGPDTDAYYLNMIELNPGNPLVLMNYAKFLKDVQGDLARAQEYCERAILVSPGDAEVLSLYAGIVWETSKDAERAENYFGRAVQADPNDCYVMASYAQFLWDAEEEDEVARDSNFTQSPFPRGSNSQSLAAAS